MYAIVQTGGKQYRVSEGDSIGVEHLPGEIGTQISLDDIRFISEDETIHVGKPKLDGARVIGTIVDQAKGDKVTVFKFKRRKMYRKKRGHRQLITHIKIDEIQFGSAPRKARQVRAQEAPEAAQKEAPRKRVAKKASKKKVTKKKTTRAKQAKTKKQPAKKAAKAAAKASKKSKKK